jgi:hypothetical protein
MKKLLLIVLLLLPSFSHADIFAFVGSPLSIELLDRSGFVIRYAVAGQMLGTAIGPTIAASVVEPGMFTNVITVSIFFFALTMLFIIPPLINHRRAVKQLS